MGSEDDRLRRKAERRARRRDEIVRAADAVAATVGLEQFTADDVARAVPVSAPSIFYYFPRGLPELRAAVALRRFHLRYDGVARGVAAAPDGIAALIAIVRGLAATYADDADAVGQELEVMLRGEWGPELVALHVSRLNAMFDLAASRVREDQEAGRLRADLDQPRRLAMLMNQLALGLVVGDRLRQKVGGRSLHATTALLDDLCAILERGLA